MNFLRFQPQVTVAPDAARFRSCPCQGGEGCRKTVVAAGDEYQFAPNPAQADFETAAPDRLLRKFRARRDDAPAELALLTDAPSPLTRRDGPAVDEWKSPGKHTSSTEERLRVKAIGRPPSQTLPLLHHRAIVPLGFGRRRSAR
jgi:hypothetical protein